MVVKSCIDSKIIAPRTLLNKPSGLEQIDVQYRFAIASIPPLNLRHAYIHFLLCFAVEVQL